MMKNIFVGLILGVSSFAVAVPAGAEDDDNRKRWKEYREDWDDDDDKKWRRSRGSSHYWDHRFHSWGGPAYAPPSYYYPRPRAYHYYPRPPAYHYQYERSWRPPVIERFPPPSWHYHSGWHDGHHRYYGRHRHHDDDDD